MDDGEINMHGILFICIKGWQNTDSCSDVDWTFRQDQDSRGLENQAESGFRRTGKSGRARIQEEWRLLWNVVGDLLMIS
jgi:hypothetical protein